MDVDINTAGMTGLGVLSAQMSLAYNPAILSVVDVVVTGTIAGTRVEHAGVGP